MKRSMRTHGLLGVALLALTGGVLAGCGENEAPIFPDFSRDVAPLLHARCVRCHGAGGMLNGDPFIDQTKGTPGALYTTGAPIQGYFDCAEDRGVCAMPGDLGPGCKRGFRYYSTPAGAGSVTLWLKQMPPGPAAPLTARESDILYNWLAHPLPASVPCM